MLSCPYLLPVTEPMSIPPHPLLASLSPDQILQTVPSGLFLVDLEQRIVYWNDEAERITGYTTADVMGRHCSFLQGIPCGSGCGLFDPSLPKPVIGATCTVRTRSGRKIVLLKNVDYLRDAAGQVVGGVESFIDLSRQTRLEMALRRQSARLERTVRRRTAELEAERAQLGALLDAMADFAYIADAELKIVYMNRAMVRTFGEQFGQNCFEIFYRRTTPCEECPMAKVLADDTVLQERRLPATAAYYEVIHSPLRAPDGSIQKLAVFRDITERKEAEEKLREANRELDAFVSMAAHDLRAPLSPILGYVDLLRELQGDQLNSQALDILGEIEKQGERMLDLLEDLLLLARVGHLPAPATPVSTELVLREVVEELRGPLEKAELQIRSEPLPPLSIPATLLSQIFTNLLGNAVRYAARPGTVIEVGSLEQGERVKLFVRDHGPGIPAADRERIFDPFYRGATGHPGGTGIGLAIVRKIVRLYQGRVWVEATPGGGATFWLEIPKAL